MAKLPGGLFSRPAGKTGNIVFGAARTRAGKVATAREFVKPSNPNTSAQQTQRSKFSEALAIVRKIGKEVYGSDWNRSISQLPGFQSMMSLFMNNMDDSFTLSVPPVINLGTLEPLVNFSVTPAAGITGFTYDWDGDTGTNGTIMDSAVLLIIEATAAASPKERDVIVKTNFDRSSTAQDVEVQESATDYMTLHYLRGGGSAEGLLSQAAAVIATSS